VVIHKEDGFYKIGVFRLYPFFQRHPGIVSGKAGETNLSLFYKGCIGGTYCLIFQQVEVVDAVEECNIDIIGLQPFQAGVHSLDNGFFCDFRPRSVDMLGNDGCFFPDAF